MLKLSVKKTSKGWQDLIVTCGEETLRFKVSSTSSRALWFDVEGSRAIRVQTEHPKKEISGESQLDFIRQGAIR